VLLLLQQLGPWEAAVVVVEKAAAAVVFVF